MVNRVYVCVISAGVAFFLIACTQSATADVIDDIFELNLNRKNHYAGYPMPTRRALRAASSNWRYIKQRREIDGSRPDDCRTDLSVYRDGFRRIYPDAPVHGRGVYASWILHMEMVHFPRLYLCAVQLYLKKAMRKFEQKGIPFRRVAQRRNPITFDYSVFKTDTDAVNAIYSVISDLVWMSYKGDAPAMFELAKVGAMDRFIRLTPRFAYYLLAVANRAGVGGVEAERMHRNVAKHLTTADKNELDQRAITRKWPRTERMVLD